MTMVWFPGLALDVLATIVLARERIKPKGPVEVLYVDFDGKDMVFVCVVDGEEMEFGIRDAVKNLQLAKLGWL